MSETDSAKEADLGPFFGRFSLNYIKSSFIDCVEERTKESTEDATGVVLEWDFWYMNRVPKV